MKAGANEIFVGYKHFITARGDETSAASSGARCNQALRDRDAEIAITPQVIYEYWVVATRPVTLNGIGMSVVEAGSAIEEWLEIFSFLADSQKIFLLWKNLVTQHQVLGKKAHDARLAATAIFYECDGIVTFNAADFQRFTPLQVLTPEQVLLA